MKSSAMVLAAVAATLISGLALARDTHLKLPIKDAMENAVAKEKLGTDVKFFFGPQATPKTEKSLGTFTSNKKTNFANKSDKEGCEWAFLSAMMSLKERAIAEGGNAVINIQSYYKKNEFSSATEYECGAGAIMGGVTMRGTVVKL
ncbi:MAG TPA: hypothetical protein VFS58_04595 [Steroidobacteraceae bacterium]|nr:hypothetical protein [Steroidobacteraceae bacterium]